MNDKTQSVYSAVISFIGDKSLALTPEDYKDLLDELEAHIRGLQECWEEEHKEES